jgi:hypothetical protein
MTTSTISGSKPASNDSEISKILPRRAKSVAGEIVRRRSGRPFRRSRQGRSRAQPLLDLLVLMQPQTPPFEAGEDVFQRSINRNRQGSRGLALKPLGKCCVGEPPHLPPLGNPFACGDERSVGLQSVVFTVLVDPRSGWHQVPKIAARPRVQSE